jgi:hypothetical protein
MDTQYERKGHVIRDFGTKEVVFTGTVGQGEFAKPSINAAKRESRELQGSALGHGLVRVAP